MIGASRSMPPRNFAERSWLRRASIHPTLPRSVLISPLCATKRNGCARSQVGKVLVENRECTTAIADTMSSAWRSG